MTDSLAHNRYVLLALAGLLVLPACKEGEPGESAAVAEAPAHTAPTLESAQSMGVPNARMPVPGVLTAGQMSQAQFEGLVAAGYENFISLRVASESGAGWEEAFASGRDVAFTRLPVAGADGLTRESVEELARLMDEAGGPTVVYCGSSNRVGALMALKAHWVDGMPADEALAVGTRSGLAGLEPAVRQLLGM
ncbi:MAG: hypothetical protein OEZ65_06890 [Gemmatimonadota bacterium]|nr:hypothetical protein [Gemmatimonadota bacterium]MDH5759298.1 hypothetical protein [Gemmatimonadota bacterium]